MAGNCKKGTIPKMLLVRTEGEKCEEVRHKAHEIVADNVASKIVSHKCVDTFSSELQL
jgi:hypothetical protein